MEDESENVENTAQSLVSFIREHTTRVKFEEEEISTAMGAPAEYATIYGVTYGYWYKDGCIYRVRQRTDGSFQWIRGMTVYERDEVNVIIRLLKKGEQ